MAFQRIVYSLGEREGMIVRCREVFLEAESLIATIREIGLLGYLGFI